jgi:hypothetical protein
MAALHVQYLNHVVASSPWSYSLKVQARCPFSRLDFLIRKVGAGYRSEPYVLVPLSRRERIETHGDLSSACDDDIKNSLLVAFKLLIAVIRVQLDDERLPKNNIIAK